MTLDEAIVKFDIDETVTEKKKMNVEYEKDGEIETVEFKCSPSELRERFHKFCEDEGISEDTVTLVYAIKTTYIVTIEGDSDEWEDDAWYFESLKEARDWARQCQANLAKDEKVYITVTNYDESDTFLQNELSSWKLPLN